MSKFLQRRIAIVQRSNWFFLQNHKKNNKIKIIQLKNIHESR